MTVEHQPAADRFVVHLDGGDAELTYARPDGRTIDLQHTEVPEVGRGRGVADAMAQAAFDYARAQGLKVIATCPFVRRWLAHHPEEHELLLRQ